MFLTPQHYASQGVQDIKFFLIFRQTNNFIVHLHFYVLLALLFLNPPPPPSFSSQ